MFIPGKAEQPVWGKDTPVRLLIVAICQSCLNRIIPTRKMGAHLPLLKENRCFHILLMFSLFWLCRLKPGALVLTL